MAVSPDVISGAGSAIGGIITSISEAKSQKAWAKYSEKLAIRQGEYEQFAAISQALALQQNLALQAQAEILDAQRAYELGQQRAIDVTEQGERALGTIRAEISSRGIVTSEGSPLLLQMKQRYETERAAINERFQGETVARQLQYSANTKDFQRQQALASAQTAAKGMDFAAKARASLFAAQAQSINPFQDISKSFLKLTPFLKDAGQPGGLFDSLFGKKPVTYDTDTYDF